jgi:colanic acid/amylovoran biosynthesis protein
MSSLSDLKLQLKGTPNRPRDAFLSAFKRADLLVISGMGGINDVFEYSCRRILSIINLAQAWNVPVFLFGQGIGPIQNTQIRDKARRVLPLAAQIALRERKYSLPLLEELGYPRDQTVVTGDDAVSLAYTKRPERLGNSIGVNLRRASYSGLGMDVEHALTGVLNDLCKELGASLRPVPISHGGEEPDVETVQRILSKCGIESDGGTSFISPIDVVRSAGHCRVVVTGSYHGGVFALSQGVPVVAISNSSYYDAKFEGLSDQFGSGCTVIRAESPSLSSEIRQGLRMLWEDADSLRPKLLSAAKSQMRKSKEAYVQLRAALLDT